MMKSEAKKDRSKEAKREREYKSKGYEKHVIYVHYRDWYVIEAQVMRINRLRNEGLRN